MKQLTDEQIQAACSGLEDLIDCCRAVIAADRELNNLTGEAQPAAMLEAQPAEQATGREVVAWGAFHFGGPRDGKLYSHMDTEDQIKAYIAQVHQSYDNITLRPAPLYTTPPAQPAREWVGLTNEEITAAFNEAMALRPKDSSNAETNRLFVRAIEAKLREKNAGQPAADDKAGTLFNHETLLQIGMVKGLSMASDDKAGGPFADFKKAGWEKECDDTDKLLEHLGLDPALCRTDGGWLNMPRIKALLDDKAGGECQWQKRHPTETNGVWKNTTEGDASWWRNHSTGWEIRKLGSPE